MTAHTHAHDGHAHGDGDGHGHGHGHAANAHGSVARHTGDTTRTQTLQARYARTLRGHLQRLAAQIRDDVADRDVLGLAEWDGMGSVGGIDRQQDDPEAAPEFRFTTSDTAVEAFDRWLGEQVDRGVLSEVSANDNQYVRSAYERGTKNADTRMRREGVGVDDMQVGVGFRLPVHANRLSRLYSRNYELLEGITTDMSEQIGEELARSFADGVNPRVAAGRIADRVDKIGMTRATTLARTEVMNAHHEGTIARYTQHGVQRVNVLVSDPCPECERIAAQAPYTTSNAEGLLPAHPNCVCSLAPVVEFG